MARSSWTLRANARLRVQSDLQCQPLLGPLRLEVDNAFARALRLTSSSRAKLCYDVHCPAAVSLAIRRRARSRQRRHCPETPPKLVPTADRRRHRDSQRVQCSSQPADRRVALRIRGRPFESGEALNLGNRFIERHYAAQASYLG